VASGGHDPADLERIEREREAAMRAIVDSTHPRRVIVSGPGTGKTTTFEGALLARGGNGLALTFLRTLADDLEAKLRHCATGSTFHAYAKRMVHSLAPEGLTSRFSLYPALPVLEAEDLSLLAAGDYTPEAITQAVQMLEMSGPLVEAALQLGTYYDAASFEDVVYRVFRLFEEDPSRIPVYRLVVVDEYQDFSLLETRFIDTLGSRSPVLIAGDDDQALYGFRHASAQYIRDLAQDTTAQLHELRYCTRCTDVVVRAVNMTIERAFREGHLVGRVSKRFECYLPDKLADSEAHPQIFDVRCTKAEYMAKYVASEIGRIPPEDVAAAAGGGHYAALVIGREHFTKPIHKLLTDGPWPHAGMRRYGKILPQPVDGYRRLARDPESNLGWRILLHLDGYPTADEAIAEALRSTRPLASLLPDEYEQPRLAIAGLTRVVLDGGELDGGQLATLATALGVRPDELTETIAVSEQRDDDSEAAALPLGFPSDPTQPSILFTSMNGAKGLSAEHVFIVGAMNGHFPKVPVAPTDQEISQFVVALSRTRKACHVVSCKVFWPQRTLRPSVFLDWIGPLTEVVQVSASSFKEPAGT
jgi:superfamily I DNA/RNA helicase